MVQEAVRTREANAKVEDRLSRGECVACDAGDVRKHVSRGLCVRCLNRYIDKVETFATDAEKAAFEAEAYRSGLVLNPYEVSRLKRKNVFDEVADRVNKKKR